VNTDDPDREWQEAAEDNAERAAWSAAAKTSIGPLLVLGLSCLLFGAAFLFTLISAGLSLYDLHGWMWWAAIATMALEGIWAMRELFPAVRALRAGPQNGGEPTLRTTLAQLASRDAWLTRLITAPVAVLAAVHWTAVSVPIVLAVSLAIVGWLALDILSLLTVRTRRTVGRILPFLYRRTSWGNAQ
jgi:hypothetical protein